MFTVPSEGRSRFASATATSFSKVASESRVIENFIVWPSVVEIWNEPLGGAEIEKFDLWQGADLLREG